MSASPIDAAAASDPIGYVDRPARGEYLRLAFACFFVSFTTAHTSLLAIVFAGDGYDLHAIGLLLSLVAFPIIGFALVSGEVIARLGALGTLRLAMVCSLLGFGSLLLTRTGFGPALASRLLQGTGQGLFLAAAYTYVQSRLDPSRFLFLLGVFSATMPVSQAIAPPFGEFVLRHWGETAFFVLGTLPGFLGLALTVGLRPLQRPARTAGLQLVTAFRPGVWEPLGAVFVNGMLFGFCAAYLSTMLVARGVPLAAFFTASLATMFASRLLALRGIERANRRLLVGAGLGLMGCGLLAVSLAGPRMWIVVAGGIGFGFGYSLTYPVIAAWIGEGLEPRERAGSQALLNTFFNIGLFAMPLPETWLIALIGYDGTLAALGCAGIAAAAFLAVRAGSVHHRFK